MKYSRLTKEQFESLHVEFSNFLAAQSIDKTEWDEIKANRPRVAEQELDVFSDLVWEGALKQMKYLEQVSSNHFFLFDAGEEFIEAIIITVPDSINLETNDGFKWLEENWNADSVQIVTGKKSAAPDRNQVVYDLLLQGANPSKGEIYKSFKSRL